MNVGPVFENSYGGLGFMMSINAGGRRGYFTAGWSLRAGARWEDKDPKWSTGLEIGYRFMRRLANGLVPHFSVTLGYNHLWQADVQQDLVYD